jgi:hypothetical protein
MNDLGPEQGLALALSDGERGRALAYADGVLRMVCERAHPTGQPLSLTLHAPGGELSLQGKSAGSKRRQDGRFDVQLKLVSLRREQRSALQQLFS